MLLSILNISYCSKMRAGIAAVCFVVHSVRCLHYVLLFVFQFSKFEENVESCISNSLWAG